MNTEDSRMMGSNAKRQINPNKPSVTHSLTLLKKARPNKDGLEPRYPISYRHERQEVACCYTCGSPAKKYELKGEIMFEWNEFLGRNIGSNEQGFFRQEDPKHRNIMLEKWTWNHAMVYALQRQCEEKEVKMHSNEATTTARVPPI